MQDEILTLPEVAQLLKVAEKTVYSMAQKGHLPAFKVGGQWRFSSLASSHKAARRNPRRQHPPCPLSQRRMAP